MANRKTNRAAWGLAAILAGPLLVAGRVSFAYYQDGLPEEDGWVTPSTSSGQPASTRSGTGPCCRVRGDAARAIVFRGRPAGAAHCERVKSLPGYCVTPATVVTCSVWPSIFVALGPPLTSPDPWGPSATIRSVPGATLLN